MVVPYRNKRVHSEAPARCSSSSDETLKLQSFTFREKEETHPLLGIRHVIRFSQQPSLMVGETEAQRCEVPWPSSEHTCSEAVLKFKTSWD